MGNPTVELRPRSRWRSPLVALALALAAALTGWFLAPVTRQEPNLDMTYGPSGPSSSSDILFSASTKLVPAAGVEARVRLQLARRPDRVLQGFSPLPQAGEVWLQRPILPFREQLGWKGETTLIHDWRGCASRDWEFLESERGLELVAETERYVRPSHAGDAEPALEEVLISYRSPILVDATAGAAYRVLYYRSLWDVANIPLALARRLGEAWRCLPFPPDAEGTRSEAPRERGAVAVRFPASSGFTDVELLGWEADGRPSFALVLPNRDEGQPPYVAEVGVPIERLLPALARLPRSSVVRWSWLDAAGSESASPDPPPELLDQIARALHSTNSTLVP